MSEKSCPNCGEELDDEMLASGVCEHCGAAFEEWELKGDKEDDEDDEETSDAETSEDEEDEEDEEEEDEEDDDKPKRKKGLR